MRARGGAGPRRPGPPARQSARPLDGTWPEPGQLLRPNRDLSTVSTALSTVGCPSRCRLYRPGSRRTVDNMALPGRADRQPGGAASEVRGCVGPSFSAVRLTTCRRCGGEPSEVVRPGSVARPRAVVFGRLVRSCHHLAITRRHCRRCSSRNFSTSAPGVMICDAMFIVTHLTEAG